ncbi:MAG: AEC family transporter [Thermoleophilia bacterium]|nr:AEC family transporter [Thermoleophilia bacterium]
MQQLLEIIGPTFFVVALGFLLGKVGKPHVTSLVDVAMFVATPCLVFKTLYSSEIVWAEAARVWASSVFVMAGSFVLAWLVFGLRGKGSPGLYLPIVFSNTINIPVPILYLAFGDEGVKNAVLYYVPNGLAIYTLGVYLASGKKELRQGIKAIFCTPLVYAAVLGLVLNLAGAEIPSVAVRSFELMGQAAVPLMLLVLGVNVTKFGFSYLGRTVTASVIRVGGGLALGWLAVWLFGLSGIARSTVIFEAAMPGAIVVAVLCSRYKTEAALCSSVVLLTTLMAVGVIPALIYYLT